MEPVAEPSRMKPLRGMIFDLDGTVADTLPVCVESFRVVFEDHHQRPYPDEEITRLFGVTEEGMIRQVLGDGWEAGHRRYLDEYARRHDAVRAPFAGIVPVLDELRQRGVRVGMVTGKGTGSTRISLRELGLEGRFDPIECGSAEGAIKPAGIRAIVTAWRLSPAEVAYIGDTAYDMEAAAEVGVVALGAGWAGTARVREALGGPTPPAAVLERTEALLDYV